MTGQAARNPIYSSLNTSPQYQPAMKNGDVAFHDRTGPVLDSITNEGLRIAKENRWEELVIEIATNGLRHGGGSANLRCTLRNGPCNEEVDEPSAVMHDAVCRLQELFASVGTPLAGATIDWVASEDKVGFVRRRCSFRYE